MESIFMDLRIRQTAQEADVGSTPTGQTEGLVEELIFKNSLQQRTTTVVTISFNILAALLVISSILVDARKSSRRGTGPRQLNKFRFLTNIHPAETFPLTISTAIAVQGLIFLGVQSTGLSSLQGRNCRAISQIVWPVFWIVAYTLLVFGIEVAFRSVQKKRFHPRRRFTVPICWSIVLTMLIATWVPSQVYKNPRDDCTTSLLSWAMPWADVALFLNSVLLLFYLLAGCLIAYQLSRTAKIDRNERIAASRTVYYLAIGVILMTGVLPFWALVVLRKSTVDAARVATIALNIFGLLTGLLYLILRSNSRNMAFRPPAASWEQKQQWRLFGSPDLDLGAQINNPVVRDRSGTVQEVVLPSKEKSEFDARVITSRAPSDPVAAKETNMMLDSPPSYRTPPKSIVSKATLSSPPSYRAPPIHNASDPLLLSTPEVQIPPQMLHSDSRSQSVNQAHYSLFPQCSGSTPAIEANQADTLQSRQAAPPALLVPSRHKRDTSDVTTATVQIGMRLSTGAVDPAVQERIRRSVTYPPITENSTKNQWTDPWQLTQPSLDGKPSRLGPSIEIKSGHRESTPHEILFRLNSNEELSPGPFHTLAPTWPKPLEDLISPTKRISSWRRFRDARMKSLPPTPVTPSKLQPSPSFRASFSEPRTPMSPTGTMRSAQRREALSLALKEDEQWPLQGVSMPLLPGKSYIPDQNRSWI